MIDTITPLLMHVTVPTRLLVSCLLCLPLPLSGSFMARLSDHPAQLFTTHPTQALFDTKDNPTPGTLVEIAREVMDRHPAAVAVDWEGNRLTYSELAVVLHEQVQRLHLAGIGRGDRVGIQVPTGSMQVYVAILAVVFSGAAYVPVDWEETQERAQAIWEAADVTVIYGADLQLTVRRENTGVADTSAPQPGDEAWILFTGPAEDLSGVATTHHSAAAIAHGQATTFVSDAPLGPGDRIMTRRSITTLPVAKKMWLAWGTGATLVPTPCTVADSHRALASWIANEGITVVGATPSMAAAWPRQTLEAVRLLILIGQDTGREVLGRLCGPGREIWTGYRDTLTAARLFVGMTPATPPESVGLPIVGMRLAVVDPEGEPVGWGKVGQVVVAGPGVDPHLDPVLNAEKYAPLPSLGWERALSTGTLVRAERDGLIAVDADETPTRVSTPQRTRSPRRWWQWWPAR